jgi:hypothetical protein
MKVCHEIDEPTPPQKIATAVAQSLIEITISFHQKK